MRKEAREKIGEVKREQIWLRGPRVRSGNEVREKGGDGVNLDRGEN